MNFNLAVVDRTTAFIGDNRAVEHCVRGDTIEVEFDTEWNDVENQGGCLRQPCRRHEENRCHAR